MRHTPVTDSDIQCFNITKNLRELYLDCPSYLRSQPSNNCNQLCDLRRDVWCGQPIRDLQLPHVIQQPNALDQPANNIIPHENNRASFDLVVVLPNSAQRQNNPENGERAGEPVAQIQHHRELPRNDIRQLNFYLNRHNILPYYGITDRGILSYGRIRPQVNQNLVYIRAAGVEERPEHTSLEVLYIRNYEKISNASLEHLAHCSPKLKLLDVSGTSVTKDGIAKFKLLKTQCNVVSDFEFESE